MKQPKPDRASQTSRTIKSSGRRSDLAPDAPTQGPGSVVPTSHHPSAAAQGIDSQAIAHDIQAITHYLRHESPLLDLIAIDVYQHLIEKYGAELDQAMTSDTILTTLRNWVRDQCDSHNLWQHSAETISANLVFLAIQAMERDLGDMVLESLDWNEFNQILFQYLFEAPAIPIKQRLHPLEEHYAKHLSQRIINDLELDHQPLLLLKRNLGLSSPLSSTPTMLGQTLSHMGPIPELASEMPMLVQEGDDGTIALSDQFQADVWASDAREVAYLRYQSKQKRHQYLEHYLTGERTTTTLPWEGINQILTKFGLNAARLHLILLAYAFHQPWWNSTFTLPVTQLVTDMGWSTTPEKTGRASVGTTITALPNATLSQKVTNILYALSCVLVKLVRVEHHGDRSISGQTTVGKLWDILMTPQGPFDWQTGHIEDAETVTLTIRPGLWLETLMGNEGESTLPSQAPISPSAPAPSLEPARLLGFSQCGHIAHQMLRLGAYHHDLTLRLVIYLMLDTQLRSGDPHPHQYQVKTLLSNVMTEPQMVRAQTQIKHGQRLFEEWNTALATLAQLQWDKSDRPEDTGINPQSGQPDADLDPTVFYSYPYPKWLNPKATMRKPRGWLQTWLDQTLEIYPGVMPDQRQVG